ncbi:MAG: hypothetical protein MK089_10545 [Phycisphaerales bacterium]|nr:hypothetical protein [Phycisphaerales bacterium]
MRIRSRHVLSFVLAVTLVVAVLPTRWLSWTADAADIVRIPVVPLASIGNRLAASLRPMRVLRSPAGTDDILEVEGQRDRLERLLRSEQMRTAELEEQLRHLQGLPASTRLVAPPLLLQSEVTGRRPDHPVSGVELQLPLEAVDRVRIGDAITWDGRWLVGRITRVSDFRLSALPLTHPDIGPLRTLVLRGEDGIDTAVPALLRQDGRGEFVTEVDRRAGISIGDRIILSDRGWPASLQAFQIGRVVELSDVDEAPLRRRLRVEPQVHLHELPWVVIVGRDTIEPSEVRP